MFNPENYLHKFFEMPATKIQIFILKLKENKDLFGYTVYYLDDAGQAKEMFMFEKEIMSSLKKEIKVSTLTKEIMIIGLLK